MDSALSSVSNWLTILAALMVADDGTFLAAGPIAVVLAKMTVDFTELIGSRSRRGN